MFQIKLHQLTQLINLEREINKTNLFIVLENMRKQKFSVDLKSAPKYKYSFNNKSYDLNLRSSLDKKIGVTRISQDSLFPDKIKSTANITFDGKSRREAYSTSKISDKQKFSQIRLPSLQKSTFFQNPQQKRTYLKSHQKPQMPGKIYYQHHIKHKSSTSTNYLQILANNHFLQTIQGLKIGKHMKISNPHPDKQKKLHKKNPKFKTVFLDLDETLVHCDQNTTNYTVKLDFPVQGGHIISAGIRVRPYCKQFLEELSLFAQIIIFTASSASYADVVLKYLDPHNKIFAHRLYRNNCTLQKGYYVKDLRSVNRRLEDSVLVDNSAYCFMLQPFNGIPIIPYYHYGKDKELMHLIPFLKQVLQADDVRIPIKNTFFWHKYFQNDNDPRDIFQTHFSQNFTK